MRVINDLHLGSTYELPSLDYYAVLALLDSPEPTIWLGDIVDMKNCRRSEVEPWRHRLRGLREAALSAGHKWITGNHSLDQVPGDESVIIDSSTYYTHGDLGLLWDEAKGRAYRQKTPGASWFKRTFFSPWLEDLRDVYGARVTSKTEQHVAELVAKHPEIKRIVCGHAHPRERLTFMVGDTTLIVLPRGVNYIDDETPSRKK